VMLRDSERARISPASSRSVSCTRSCIRSSSRHPALLTRAQTGMATMSTTARPTSCTARTQNHRFIGTGLGLFWTTTAMTTIARTSQASRSRGQPRPRADSLISLDSHRQRKGIGLRSGWRYGRQVVHEHLRVQLFARLNGDALGESCRPVSICRVERGCSGRPIAN
jgi:hypothetical protein